jgi:F0F1-type ATP synthase assembly protein I
LIGIFAGAYLDEKLGWSPLFLILGSVLGTTAGIYSMWKTTSAMIDRFERKKQTPER